MRSGGGDRVRNLFLIVTIFHQFRYGAFERLYSFRHTNEHFAMRRTEAAAQLTHMTCRSATGFRIRIGHPADGAGLFPRGWLWFEFFRRHALNVVSSLSREGS